MARQSKFASMSVETLLKMRDDIGKVLSSKVGQLESQLAALGKGGWITSGKKAVGRPRGSKMEAGRSRPNIAIPRTRPKPGLAVVQCRDGWPPRSKQGRSASISL